MPDTEPTDRRTRASRVSGFTLIELVVVICALAVLATLVCVCSGHANALARITHCKARLHDAGSALGLYAADNRSVYPVGQEVSTRVGEKYFNHQPELMDALYPKYASSMEIFYCPAETRPEFEYAPDNTDLRNIGYFYFSDRTAPSNLYTAQFFWRRGGISWPRKLRTGMDSKTWVMSDCWLSGTETPHRDYKRGVCFLTLDGAVDMVGEEPRGTFK